MDRKCTSCGTTDTPKWRCGMTLCNACGLRTCKRIPGHRDDNGMHAQGLGWQGLTPSRLGPYTCFPVYCVACTDRPSAMALPRTSDVFNEHQLQPTRQRLTSSRSDHVDHPSFTGAEAGSGGHGMANLVANYQDQQQSSLHSMQGMAMGIGMSPGMVPSQMGMPSMRNVGMGNVEIGNLHMGYQMSSHQSRTSWNGGMHDVVPGGMGSITNGQMSFMQQQLISQTSGNCNNMMMGRTVPSQMPSSAGMASNSMGLRPSTVGSFSGSANALVMPSQQPTQMATVMHTMLPMRPWM